jgi:hypothetical protein
MRRETMDALTLHSWTPVPEELRWIAFRDASTAAVASPKWTEQGDTPAEWCPPPDAAGGLWVKGMVGPEQIPSAAHAVGEYTDSLVCGAYFSSGAQGVFLCWVEGYAIAIVRPEVVPRFGHRETMLQHLGLHPRMQPEGCTIPEVEVTFT